MNLLQFLLITILLHLGNFGVHCEPFGPHITKYTLWATSSILVSVGNGSAAHVTFLCHQAGKIL